MGKIVRLQTRGVSIDPVEGFVRCFQSSNSRGAARKNGNKSA